MASILTNTGRIKLATATPEDQLNVTQIAVGDGNGGFPELTPDMTGLTNEVWRGTVSLPIRSNDDTTIIFEGFIASSIGGFYVREAAIFDEDGDMIAIGHTSEIEKPDPNSGNPASLSIRLHVALSSAEQVDLIYNDDPTIDHNGLSGREDADSHPASAISTEALAGISQSESDVASILALLKTAALRDAQTSKTDSTTNALLAVGAFGLGSTLPTIDDWDDTELQTGIYRPNNNATGDRPTGNAGSVLIHCRSTDTLQSQICLQSNSSQPRTYRRNYNATDGWGSWVELLDSDTNHNDIDGRSEANAHPATSIQTSALTGLGVTSNSTVQAVLALLKSAAKVEIQTSETDSTAGRALILGAFGLGSSAIPTVGNVDDTDLKTGIYRPSNETGTLPSNNAGSVLIHVRTTATIQSQLFLQSNNNFPRTYRRNYSSSGWGDWVEVLDTGNAAADMVSSDSLSNVNFNGGTVQDALNALDLVVGNIDDEVGCIKYFITTVTPTGRYIKANGAAVSRTAYADLFAKVGTFWGEGDGSTTFNVPDLRGEFIRTWDDGRGLDAGRSFGVVQSGQIEAHTHGLTNEGSAQAGSDNGGAPISSSTGYTTTRELSDTESYGGSETRPRNISLIAWIRY
jgi:phage-related tail fiber protein